MIAPAEMLRFVEFQPDPFGSRWECVEGSVRRGARGVSLGSLSVRHASGYAILLKLDNGKFDTFPPNALRPDRSVVGGAA
jgi:hypothetical protein